MLWRMFVKSEQHAAQIDDFLAVELQRGHCGAPGRSESDDLQIIGAPGEMLTPLLATWMKQGKEFPGERIARPGLCMFVIVAALTGERQVARGRPPAALFRHNVFEGEGMG